MDDKEKYTGPDRRSNKVWDRRIPAMPTKFGKLLQFMFKTKRRFVFLFIIACIGYIAVVADITIMIYKRFFNPCF